MDFENGHGEDGQGRESMRARGDSDEFFSGQQPEPEFEQVLNTEPEPGRQTEQSSEPEPDVDPGPGSSTLPLGAPQHFHARPPRPQVSWDKQSYVEDADDETGEALLPPSRHPTPREERSREPPSARRRNKVSVFESPELVGLGDVLEEDEEDELGPLDSVSQKAHVHGRKETVGQSGGGGGERRRMETMEERMRDMERRLRDAEHRAGTPRGRGGPESRRSTADSTGDAGESADDRGRGRNLGENYHGDTAPRWTRTYHGWDQGDSGDAVEFSGDWGRRQHPGENYDGGTAPERSRTRHASDHTVTRWVYGQEPLQSYPSSRNPSRKGSYSRSPKRSRGLDDEMTGISHGNARGRRITVHARNKPAEAVAGRNTKRAREQPSGNESDASPEAAIDRSQGGIDEATEPTLDEYNGALTLASPVWANPTPDVSPESGSKKAIRIPKQLVSLRALIDLRYPFTDTEDAFVISEMEQDKINALLELSLRYIREENRAKNHPPSTARTNTTLASHGILKGDSTDAKVGDGARRRVRIVDNNGPANDDGPPVEDVSDNESVYEGPTDYWRVQRKRLRNRIATDPWEISSNARDARSDRSDTSRMKPARIASVPYSGVSRSDTNSDARRVLWDEYSDEPSDEESDDNRYRRRYTRERDDDYADGQPRERERIIERETIITPYDRSYYDAGRRSSSVEPDIRRSSVEPDIRRSSVEPGIRRNIISRPPRPRGYEVPSRDRDTELHPPPSKNLNVVANSTVKNEPGWMGSYPSFLPISSTPHMDNITVTVPVRDDVMQSFTTGFNLQMAGGLPLGQQSTRGAWEKRRTPPDPSGLSTEMLTVHALEYLVGGDGHYASTVTLVCPPPTDGGEATVTGDDNVQLRWMHVEAQPSAKAMESFVLGCPYVSPKIRSLGIMLLRDAVRRFRSPSDESYMMPGSVLRYVGAYPEDATKETEPVVFALAPHVILQQLHSVSEGRDLALAPRGDSSTRGLLHFLHGHHVGNHREGCQAVSRVPASKPWGDKGVIHVAQTWCLLLGSKTLITFGCLSLQELLGTDVRIDERLKSPRGPVTVRVDMPNLRSLFMVVDRGCTFAAFLKTVSAQADVGDDNWFLYISESGKKGHGLTVKMWVGLLAEPSRRELRLLLERERELVWIRSPDGGYEKSYLQHDGVWHSTTPDYRDGTFGARTSTPRLHGPRDDTTSPQSMGLVVNSPDQLPGQPPVFSLGNSSSSDDDDPESDATSSDIGNRRSGSAQRALGDGHHMHGRPPMRLDSSHHARRIESPTSHRTMGDHSHTEDDTWALAKFHDIGFPEKPFFTWRIKDVDAETVDGHDVAGHESGTTSSSQLVRLLRKIHKVSGGLYWEDSTGGLAAKCSLKAVEARVGHGSTLDATDNTHNYPAPDAGTRRPANYKNQRSPASSSNGNNLRRYELGPVFGPLMQELVATSRKLVNMFVPHDAGPGVDIEESEILMDLGGSIDRLIRNVHYRLYTGNKKGQEQWQLTEYPPRGSRLMPDEQIVFFSLEAALRRHHEHQRCPALAVMDRVPNLADDPCYSKVWPRHAIINASADNNRLNWVYGRIEALVQRLQSLASKALELHMLVKSPDSSNHAIPLLPQSIVSAFRCIVSHMLLESEAISGMFNLYRDPKTDNMDVWRRLRRNCEISLHQALHNLRAAQEDILIMQTTVQASPSVRIHAVGPEVLLAVLLSNTQSPRLPLDPSPLSRPQTPVEFYHRYVTQLQFTAHAKSSTRRVLVSIRTNVRALEEELAALRAVNAAHKLLWDGLCHVLDPKSFRITNGTRITSWKEVEQAYIDSQLKLLGARDSELVRLSERAVWLKDEIKQSIDVLEEEHGKAIRVFTVVTLFFLPLSFVSSVFGMNTADVRDMAYDQSMFWATSMPVTAVVLLVAFVYGYKMDGIMEWVREWKERRRKGEDGEDQDEDGWAKLNVD